MRVTDNYIFFWKEHPFCNFTKCKIKFEYPDSKLGEEIYFTSSEQMFMWFKAKQFMDEESAEKILAAKTPEEARQLGRGVKGYVEWVWNDERYHAMHKAVMAKFIQNKDLRDKLCDPKYDGKKFVEASPYDRIWGIGYGEEFALKLDNAKNWGTNLLGKVLDETRAWCLEYREMLDKNNIE